MGRTDERNEIIRETVVLAATLDAKFQLREMLLAKTVRENIIPDIDGIDYSEKHNAYVIGDSTIFVVTLERLLSQLTTRESVYLGPI